VRSSQPGQKVICDKHLENMRALKEFRLDEENMAAQPTNLSPSVPLMQRRHLLLPNEATDMLGQSKIPNPEYWRARAEATRALAHQTLDPISKQSLVMAAESYEALARASEAEDAKKQSALASASGRLSE
jgi:hypothetical protein